MREGSSNDEHVNHLLTYLPTNLLTSGKTKVAFTLAEVLITLSIIGIVAALTMPSLIAKHQEQVLINKTKKVYSIFSQAFVSASNEYGSPENWELGDTYDVRPGVVHTDVIGNTNMFNKFAPYVKFIKTCEAANSDECFIVSDNNLRHKAKVGILADGSQIYMFSRSNDCTMEYPDEKIKDICGDITYQYGESYLRFWLTKKGIIPKGFNNVEPNSTQGFDYCLKNATSIKNIPEGCTAWIVFNGNLDFLRCKDLSWDGKTKCSDK